VHTQSIYLEILYSEKSIDVHTHFDIPEVKIDDEPIDVANCFSLEVTDTKLEAQLNLNLKGKKNYDFLIKMRKVVPYEENRTKSVSTIYFIHNLNVTFTYRKLLKVEFMECGTIGSFKTIGEHDIDLNSKQLIKRYNGLIFPKQGFVFFLTK